MQTSIQKWGNSLAIRIPRPLAIHAHFSQGVVVDMDVVEEKLVLVAHKAIPKYSLKALLKKVRPQNLHREVLTGLAVGREVW